MGLIEVTELVSEVGKPLFGSVLLQVFGNCTDSEDLAVLFRWHAYFFPEAFAKLGCA